MTKARFPALSLGAHGTLADTITYQTRTKTHFARRKPIPTDPKALAQLYQRWDVQNYALLWHSQTESQKLAWRKAGSRRGITGYNAFLRDRLKNLPDLIGRWHLDEQTGSGAFDSSRNGINATIYGALPVNGRISLARWFDKVDDYVKTANSPKLHPTVPFSFEAWVNPLSSGEGGWGRVAEIPGEFQFHMLGEGLQDIRFSIYFDTVLKNATSSGSKVTYGKEHHVVGVWDGSNVILFVNKQKFTGDATVGTKRLVPAEPVYIGNRYILDRTWHGWIDEVVYYNRALTQADVDLRFDRRYPL